ncbi:PhoH family protein [Flavobacteriaceae bacterium]|nr:PhoH family protein [Flavobacteriaceae bacterium]
MAKIFVLDTSVLLFDHSAIDHFEDNDVVLPIPVLEELDNFKLGNETKNYEARSIIRYLDELSANGKLNEWRSLGTHKGRLMIDMSNEAPKENNAVVLFNSNKNDHQILNSAQRLKEKHPKKQVILVTKDINLRIKAKAIGIDAEDYKAGKIEDKMNVQSDGSIIYDVEPDLLQKLYQERRIPEGGILGDRKVANNYFFLRANRQTALAKYHEEEDQIRLVEKQLAYGIRPRNAEQTFALDALMDAQIPLVAVQGVAGTGKTLLALASAVEQKNIYDQIILARPTVPLSNKELGFLPGDAEDKIAPYMAPLWDNLKFIKSQYSEHSKKRQKLDSMTEDAELQITALNFIRGRTLTSTMFIIDEAQNLTPHEVKTIITRAGEGTKVVFTGDINQIDTPYLDTYSNGLSYIIEKLKGQSLFAHIKLENGERSELANLANVLL